MQQEELKKQVEDIKRDVVDIEKNPPLKPSYKVSRMLRKKIQKRIEPVKEL